MAWYDVVEAKWRSRPRAKKTRTDGVMERYKEPIDLKNYTTIRIDSISGEHINGPPPERRCSLSPKYEIKYENGYVWARATIDKAGQ
jgi:hypothetical protein